jgi:hypothetical protein
MQLKAWFIGVSVLITTTHATILKTMRTGLGEGSISSAIPGISCGSDCSQSYGVTDSVILVAAPLGTSRFEKWLGDCRGTAVRCTVLMNEDRSVRAQFGIAETIDTLTEFLPDSIEAYLRRNPHINTPARFVAALPSPFKRNWILMSRSESLQPGTSEMPRILLPSDSAHFVFTLGLSRHASYPGAHPNAIEYMQWDRDSINFRFHEIVVDTIPPMGVFAARSRGVSKDDNRCTKCHTTRNVMSSGPNPGTTGMPIGRVKAKGKPNWDPYDSWGGMLPFNRDRIYQGSIEAAAIRKIFNPWTWMGRDSIGRIIDLLELQPPGVSNNDSIRRVSGGANEGMPFYSFDPLPITGREDSIAGPIRDTVFYQFDGIRYTTGGSEVRRGGDYIILQHNRTPQHPSGEGRAVQFFDFLGGQDGNLNPKRIADEIAGHRFITGSMPFDVRPIALAITKNCLNIDVAGDSVRGSTTRLDIYQTFFRLRHGTGLGALRNDTRARQQSMPLRKADIQHKNLTRLNDAYLESSGGDPGLVRQYGSTTARGTAIDSARIRQEVFRRPFEPGLGDPDATAIGGKYIDREKYPQNTDYLTLFRYFLEPFGVSVDKWSTGVRGRSRTYTFADIFVTPINTYVRTLQTDLEASLASPDSIPGLRRPFACPDLITHLNGTLDSADLPEANATPTYTDVQRIFNKNCIECHGGLDYPPYANYRDFFSSRYLDLSETENASARSPLDSSYADIQRHIMIASPGPISDAEIDRTDLIERLTTPSGNCPEYAMPCGGPPISQADLQTLRRWIRGGRPNSAGDPHLTTVDSIAYDFQSAGEFTLLRGPNLEVQVRQTPVPTQGPLGVNSHTGLSTCASINTAVAMRVGAHRITYQPDGSGSPNPQGLQLRLDGKLIEKLGPRGMVLSQGGRILPIASHGALKIEFADGADIVITPDFWHQHQVWFLNVDFRRVRATDGLIGSVGNGQWLPALADGSRMGLRPTDASRRYRDLYVTFADSWRVTAATSLFDYAAGATTHTYTFKEWPGENASTCRAPEIPGAKWGEPLKPLSAEIARQHCRDVIEWQRRANCEADVMATGDPTFVDAYVRTEQIQRNAPPPTPELLFPARDQGQLPTSVTFKWKVNPALDAEPLTYMFCHWQDGQDGQRFNYKNCRDLPKPGLLSTLSAGPKRTIAVFLALVLIVLLFLVFRYPRLRVVFLALLLVLVGVLHWLITSASPTITPTQITHQVTGLNPKTGYHWMVVVDDTLGATAYSEPRRFMTGP